MYLILLPEFCLEPMIDLNPAIWAVLLLFALSWCIQIFYYLRFYLPATFRPGKQNEAALPPVSVVICARNEAENLQSFLPGILEQEYPDYEVVVVNDSSEDATDEVLWEMQKKYPRLRFTAVPQNGRFSHGKKMALLIGIKSAKNEVLLLTDADCRAAGPQWIRSMVSAYDPETDLVLGYGGYEQQKGLINNLQRYDTAWIALQYGGFAKAGIPYMGVGRNLSYRKSFFMESKGFARHMHLFSGDDDLLVNEQARKGRVMVNFAPSAHTRSIPVQNGSEWLKQKNRHISTFSLYKPLHKFLLLLEPASRMLYYGLLIYLLIRMTLWPWILIAPALRFILRMITLFRGYRLLQEKRLLLSSVVWDFIYPFLGLGLNIMKIGKPKARTWK